MTDIPVINDSSSRRESILNNTPAIFNIEDNPDADKNYGSLRSIASLGLDAIEAYDKYIDQESKAQGVDPDLVRAIMYVENAQGLLPILAIR